jgi:DNA-binding response OmpR family regulator
MMPVMNGVEVVRVLRQDWQLATLPVIMVTARAESEAVVAALDAGADDYVTKPIDFEVLRARIETQLAKQRSSDQLKQANAALDERATMRVLAFDELKTNWSARSPCAAMPKRR